MTSVADDRNRGIDVEDESCSQWPLEPAAENRGKWSDPVAVDHFGFNGRSVSAGDRLKCKSCWDRYGSRRGRWWIARAAHTRLVDREAGYILRMSLVRASRVDQLIGGRWTHCGRGGKGIEQYRQLPWSAVFDLAETLGGEQA